MPYPDDPEMRRVTLELLGRSWTRLPAAVERARAWGVDWCEISTPFVERVGQDIVAHVGVIELPLVLDGQLRRYAGVHAVCTRADQRRRGHMRAAIDRALSWTEQHFDGALLWANDAAIYAGFGFVARSESMFVGPVRGGPATSTRTLSLERAEDVALVSSYLARRAPVSQRSDMQGGAALTLLDLALWWPGPSLAHIPELDCIVVHAVRERFLDVYDVIAAQPVALAELAARLGEHIDTAVVYFTPDLLDAPQLRAEPTGLIDTLMVRGPWIEGPLAIAPTRRC